LGATGLTEGPPAAGWRVFPGGVLWTEGGAAPPGWEAGPAAWLGVVARVWAGVSTGAPAVFGAPDSTGGCQPSMDMDSDWGVFRIGTGLTRSGRTDPVSPIPGRCFLGPEPWLSSSSSPPFPLRAWSLIQAASLGTPPVPPPAPPASLTVSGGFHQRSRNDPALLHGTMRRILTLYKFRRRGPGETLGAVGWEATECGL